MEPLPAVLIAGTILVLCAYALDMQGFPVLVLYICSLRPTIQPLLIARGNLEPVYFIPPHVLLLSVAVL